MVFQNDIVELPVFQLIALVVVSACVRRVLATARKFDGLSFSTKSDTALPVIDSVENRPRTLFKQTVNEHNDQV